MPTAEFTNEDLKKAIAHLTGFKPNIIIGKKITDKDTIEVNFR